MPDRLGRFLESLAVWRERGVVFAPIRHHSPGCSQALKALCEELEPARILIEGPREYTALLPALGSERSVPPLSVLSTSESGAAFYPLAPFSPEWVALRWGIEHGAVVDFIDQSYADQPETDDFEVHTLQREAHLARSEALAALARSLGCRDHDEVWEHLFEVRSSQGTARWREFFDEVAAWSGIARCEYGRQELDADGTHSREAVMLAVLEQHMRERDAGGEHAPIVVVTGGFHTLGLVDALDGCEEGAWIRDVPVKGLESQRDAYLVRYDYTRLDGLRGYGAGMPAPGLWNRSWLARMSGKSAQEFVLDVILDVAGRAREDGELLPTATVQAAVEQTLLLADLRDRAWPGRTDILDAMLSCFVRDEFGFTGPLAAALTDTFGGNELGQIPDNIASPPLVAEARAKAQELRFSVETSQPKQVSLDTARKARHVRRREFLALMRFIGSGFAAQTSGADVVRGRDLGLLFEEWEYAWTPMVESRLIDLSATGPTLDTAVAVTLARRMAELGVDPTRQAHGTRHGQGPQQATTTPAAPPPNTGGSMPPHTQATRTSQPAQIAGLICEIAAFGGHVYLERVLDRLVHTMSEEPHVSELVAALHKLADLVDNRGRLDLRDHVDRVQRIIVQGLEALRYQLPTAVRVEGEEQEQLVTTLMSVRDLLHRGATPEVAAENLRLTLNRLREDGQTPQRIVGALVGLAYIDGGLSQDEAVERVVVAFNPVADPEGLTEFLLGLMRVAPDLVLHSPELLEAVDRQLAQFDEQAFRAVLPDLRQAFGSLKPLETHTLAGNVAALHNAQVGQIDVRLSAAPQDIAYGTAIERLLVSSLERDGLGEWMR